jgi:hypothetical protein
MSNVRQDVYHRDDGHTVVDGTFTADSGDKLTPSTYSDSASDVQVYQNSWLLASDQLTYKYAQSTDTDLSVSDKPIVAAANYNGPLGTLSGTTDESPPILSFPSLQTLLGTAAPRGPRCNGDSGRSEARSSRPGRSPAWRRA